MEYRVFTEGDWDKNFIETLLKHIFGENYGNRKISFRTANGYTTLESNQNFFQEITDAGGINILIYDCDFISTGGGYQTRTAYLLAEKARLNLEFKLFLFPNNNEEGRFEDLLESIIVDRHRNIMNCFNGYENCINQLNNMNPLLGYHTPNKKAKIYSYVETISNPNEFEKARKANNMFYSDSNYWDLNSPSLNPIVEFFRNIIV